MPAVQPTLYGEICRIDAEKREVWALASTETLGTDGRILGYEGTLRAFAGWPGNVREQHNLHKAVGRAVHWEPVPDQRAVLLGARISRGAEDTWQKVLDGTLRYFSVRGPLRNAIMRSFTVNGVQRSVPYVTEWVMEEASLVDRPGDAGATEFTIVRGADFSAVEPFVLDAAAQEAINAQLAAALPPTTADPAPEIARAAATKTVDGKAYPAGDFAYVPDAQSPDTWKLRLTSTPGGAPDPAIVGAAAAALGPKGYRGQKVQLPAADRAKVVAKVRAAWRKANPGKGAQEMPEGLIQRAADAAHEQGDIDKAAQIIALIRELIGSEAGEVVEGDSDDLYQLGSLGCALSDLQSFARGESYEVVMAQRSAHWEEGMRTQEEMLTLIQQQQTVMQQQAALLGTLVERAGTATPAAPPVEAPAPAAQVEPAAAPPVPPTPAAPATAGVLTIADATAAALRAAGGPAPAAPAPSPALLTAVPPAGFSAEQWAGIQRAMGMLAPEAPAIPETVDKDTVIAGLVERVARLEAQPATTRPVLRTEGLSVNKLFPGETVPVEPEQVERAFTDIATQAKDPSVRERAQLGAVVEAIRGVREATHRALAG